VIQFFEELPRCLVVVGGLRHVTLLGQRTGQTRS
jgi:hypothetical protein